MEIELTLFTDNKQNVCFKGKEIAQILGYEDSDQDVRRHIPEKYKNEALQKEVPSKRRGIPKAIFVTEPGFYELVFKSKLPTAEKF